MQDKTVQNEWRWQGTTLAAPLKAGVRVSPIGEIARSLIPVTAFGRSFRLPLPNISACLLNLSYTMWKDASTLRKELSNITNCLHLKPAASMNYYERIMSCTVLAFASLESFINYMVPHDAKYIKRNKKGISIELSKSSPERESTEIKLGDALPSLLNYDTPKGKKEWESFIKLKDHRDRILHSKTHDQVPDIKSDHLWSIWISDNCPAYPDIAWSMIEYISIRVENCPLWVKQYGIIKKYNN